MSELPYSNFTDDTPELQEVLTLPPALKHYIGARVTVYYNGGVTDTGAVTYLDTYWVELAKGEERLLIPIRGLRLIKLLDPVRPEEQAAYLLRAAGDPPKEKKVLPK